MKTISIRDNSQDQKGEPSPSIDCLDPSLIRSVMLTHLTNPTVQPNLKEDDPNFSKLIMERPPHIKNIAILMQTIADHLLDNKQQLEQSHFKSFHFLAKYIKEVMPFLDLSKADKETAMAYSRMSSSIVTAIEQVAHHDKSAITSTISTLANKCLAVFYKTFHLLPVEETMRGFAAGLSLKKISPGQAFNYCQFLTPALTQVQNPHLLLYLFTACSKSPFVFNSKKARQNKGANLFSFVDRLLDLFILKLNERDAHLMVDSVEWLSFLKALTALDFNLKESRFTLVSTITLKFLNQAGKRELPLIRRLEMATELIDLENLFTKKLLTFQPTDPAYFSLVKEFKDNFGLLKENTFQVKSLMKLVRKTRIDDEELLLMLVGELLHTQQVKEWKLMSLANMAEFLQYFAINAYRLVDKPDLLQIIQAWSYTYLSAYNNQLSEAGETMKPSNLSQTSRILWSLCILFDPTSIKPHTDILFSWLPTILDQGEGEISVLSMLA